MSHPPTAQFGHGTGSGRRTIPTTRSPASSPTACPGSSTRPRDSWPSTRRSDPDGLHPYLPSTISRSVPHTPTATASTSTEPSRGSGSRTSSSLALPTRPGSTVTAFMSFPFTALKNLLDSDLRLHHASTSRQSHHLVRADRWHSYPHDVSCPAGVAGHARGAGGRGSTGRRRHSARACQGSA